MTGVCLIKNETLESFFLMFSSLSSLSFSILLIVYTNLAEPL